MVTAVLALGVQRMARRNAIVRKLAGGRDARLGRRHRLGQDRHADHERDDRARRRHGERARGRSTGTGYAPDGRGRGTAAGRSTRRAAHRSCTARWRAADRANNAVLQERDGRWTVQGDPTEGALIVAARKAGLERRGRWSALRARRRGAVLLRAQADEHGPYRRRARRSACSSSPRARRTSCWRAARTSWSATEPRPLTDERRAAIRGGQRGARRRGAAHARRRLPLAARATRCGRRRSTRASSTSWSSSG